MVIDNINERVEIPILNNIGTVGKVDLIIMGSNNVRLLDITN